MGISPNVWGPSAWAFIHLTAMAEPDDFDKTRLVFYKRFFELLQELLPCEKCRQHLKQNMTKLKDIEKIKSKRELFDWTADLHNKVNEITNKSLMSKEDAYNYWELIAIEKKSLKSSKWFIVALLLFLVLVFSLLLFLMLYRQKTNLQKPQSRSSRVS
jgi:hypothetical protein